MAGTGETPIAIGFLHDVIKYQEAAQMFVDWCLTKEAQEMGKTVGSFQFLTHEDALPPDQAIVLKDTKLIEYDEVWAGDNRELFLEKFMELTKTTPPTE